MFGYLYELWLVWDALRLKNTIQVIGLVIYNLGILIYAAIQFDQIKDATEGLRGKNFVLPTFWPEVRPLLITLPCLMAFATFLFAFEAWKLYDEFAWTIYKHISADLRLKRRYLTYQVRFALSNSDDIAYAPRFTLLCSSSTSSFSSPSQSSSSSSSTRRPKSRSHSPPPPLS
jgi:hypothetical protein